MSFVTFLLAVAVALVAILIGIINLELPEVNEFMIKRAFDRFEDGVFCVKFLEDATVWKFGDLTTYGARCDNTLTIVNKQEAFAGLLHGSIGLGTSYYEGHWNADKNEGEDQDLGDLFVHMVYNLKTTIPWYAPYLRYLRLWDWQEYWERVRLTKDKEIDREHINAHYFNNDFFECVLDESMTYTHALFNLTTSSLAEAQMNKINTLMHKMRLGRGYHDGRASGNILDVGSGWGYLVSTINNRSDGEFNVTGITLADAQFEYSDRMYGNANGEKQAQLQSPYYYLMDFRDLHDVYGDDFFDGIFSVEAFSHIHIKRVEEWFEILYKILKPGGAFVMQSLVASQVLTTPGLDDHFILKSKACTGYNYAGKVLPGGCVMAGDWIQEFAAKAGFFNMHREHTGSQYSRTLHEFRMNLNRNRERAMRALDGNEKYYRMFEIYLAHAEGAYRIGSIDSAQFVFYKPKSLQPGKGIYNQKFERYSNDIHFPILDWPRNV